jgi:translation initiation factor IF-3
MFRRREMRRPENGYEVLDRVRRELGDLIKVEREPIAVDGARDLTMVIVPARRAATATAAAASTG